MVEILHTPTLCFSLVDIFQFELGISFQTHSFRSRVRRKQEKCETCINHIGSNTKLLSHCHCAHAEIPDVMVEVSLSAWRREQERPSEQTAKADTEKVVNEEKREMKNMLRGN